MCNQPKRDITTISIAEIVLYFNPVIRPGAALVGLTFRLSMSKTSSVILGLRISPSSADQVFDLCRQWLAATPAATSVTANPKIIFTPNPEIAVYAYRHPEYKQIVQSADLLIPDGIGLYLAARGALPERVTGVDLMMRLLTYAEQQGITVACILNRQGLSSPADIEQAMRREYPKLKCMAVYADAPAAVTAQLILVGLGFPAQEYWCDEHRTTLPNAKILLAVGGSLDYLTRRQTRAPGFLRIVGLEWLWRVVHQPWRLSRILTATIIFPWLVFKHRYARPKS